MRKIISQAKLPGRRRRGHCREHFRGEKNQRESAARKRAIFSLVVPPPMGLTSSERETADELFGMAITASRQLLQLLSQSGGRRHLSYHLLLLWQQNCAKSPGNMRDVSCPQTAPDYAAGSLLVSFVSLTKLSEASSCAAGLSGPSLISLVSSSPSTTLFANLAFRLRE